LRIIPKVVDFTRICFQIKEFPVVLFPINVQLIPFFDISSYVDRVRLMAIFDENMIPD
tara:strand:- start:2912 stop:3085 length:174 start_codon:yes stop_codon:yes gene_type:complete